MGSEMRKWVKEPAAHHDMKLKFHWPVMMADRINPPMANKIRTKITTIIQPKVRMHAFKN